MWAFSDDERRADIAVAKDAGSLDCFFRSQISLLKSRSILFDLTS